MDTVIKAAIVFAVLFMLIRASGRRVLGEMTSFDFVLLLIIGGATQRALTGEDYSLVNAFIIVATLFFLDVALSLAESRFPWLGKWLNGLPMIVVEHGRGLPWWLRRARLTEAEVMVAARRHHGLEQIGQVKFAILEANGQISIIPEIGS